MGITANNGSYSTLIAHHCLACSGALHLFEERPRDGPPCRGHRWDYRTTWGDRFNVGHLTKGQSQVQRTGQRLNRDRGTQASLGTGTQASLGTGTQASLGAGHSGELGHGHSGHIDSHVLN